MKTTLSLLMILFFGIQISVAQPASWKAKKYFTITGYNVENLFDTIDVAGKSDEEFTSNGEKNWNTERYNQKIENISKVISGINGYELPEIVGLIEIENNAVLKDLVASQNLSKGNYQIVHEEGPDPRGIECALIYRPDEFKYLSHKAIEVRFPFSENRRTRDILYVKGLVKKDTLHVFVNHWTSRRGGEDASEIKRMQSASVLKHATDSILAINPNASIFIMGDFNDEPTSQSIAETLDAGKPADNKTLTNLLYDKSATGLGSYYFKDSFNMLDNMIVSKALMQKKKGLHLFENTAWIYNPDYICYTQKDGIKSPSKTYGGKKYFGGYSDHFPVYTIFYTK